MVVVALNVKELKILKEIIKKILHFLIKLLMTMKLLVIMKEVIKI
jgi:hypothetical protein